MLSLVPRLTASVASRVYIQSGRLGLTRCSDAMQYEVDHDIDTHS